MGAEGTDWLSSRRHVASGKLRHVAALQIGPAPSRSWQASSLMVAAGGLVKVACFLLKRMGHRRKAPAKDASVALCDAL